MSSDPPLTGAKFDVVICLETLEHVLDVRSALNGLLAITRKTLLITVPIETGPIGIGKYVGKSVLRRPTLTEEHVGSRRDYLIALLRGQAISHFRAHPSNNHWALHTGWDYRVIPDALRSIGVAFQDRRHGWNRFFIVER